jgi:hypothetical protein
MRFTAISSLLLVVFCASPADSTSAIDPIFGIKYAPTAVVFPQAPDNLKTICKDLTNERYDRKIWIFAQTHGTGARFLVIGGNYIKRGAVPTSEPDVNGAVLKLEGDSCNAVGAARDVFEYPPPQLSAEAIRELSNDAVCTYARAFGSYARFRTALRSQHSSSPSQALTQAISKPSCP